MRQNSQREGTALSVVETERALRPRMAEVRRSGGRIALVPTMGALHAGHLSLIRAARGAADYVVVSIFVNPTQFGPGEDFERYPRPLDEDLAMCRQAEVDLVFHPSVETMYPAGFSTCIDVRGLSKRLEGAFRPGHFRGVATVVMKLLQLTQPDVAYFGQKDYQQLLVVRTLCRDLNVPVDIQCCPIVREADGLAVSSRNRYLTTAERRSALALSQSLQLAAEHFARGETDVTAVRTAMRRHLEATPGVTVDYATVAHPDTLEEISRPLRNMVALVAARVGTTRLIDNLLIDLG